MADEVICGFGRLGEWLGVQREGVRAGPRQRGQGPDLGLRADGRGARLRPRRRAAVRRPAAPCATASRSAVTRSRPRSRCGTSRSSSATGCSRTCGHWSRTWSRGCRSCARCRSSATSAAAASSGRSSSSATRAPARFDADERDRLLRGYLPGRLLEAGIIARADDRGDSVLQIAPPLISDAGSLTRSSTASARCWPTPVERWGWPARSESRRRPSDPRGGSLRSRACRGRGGRRVVHDGQ